MAVGVVLWGGAIAVAAPPGRINLVEFGRVVELSDQPARVTTTQDELARGSDGWDAVKGPGGDYSIAVEWDEPRDIAEVNIEFRHAIAHREQLRVQYWMPADSKADPAGRSAAGAGRWLTPEADWWAGDRDVSFAFLPQDKEPIGRQPSSESCRRTTRIRFLCGSGELPPVRYLRAYGLGKPVSDTFDVRFDARDKLAPPVLVKIVNGFVLSGDGGVTMESAVIHEAPGTLVIRYARENAASPNRTQVLVSPVDAPSKQFVFLPAEAARLGRVRVAEAGLVVERRGGPSVASAPAHPAVPTTGQSSGRKVQSR